MKAIIISMFALVLFALLIWSLASSCPVMDKKENWVDYVELPYGNIRSGAGNPNIRPMAFYNNHIYRRPLNWPICHLVDYPVPHCRSDAL